MIDVDQIEQKPRHIKAVETDPASIAGRGIMYPKLIGGVVEFFYRDSNEVITQITDNGSLRLPTSPSLVPEGGSKDSILSKSSSSDFATVWRKQNELMNEFYFVLPKAVSVDARVTAMSSVAGLSLFSADNDPSPDDEFGALPSTLIIKPTGLMGVILGSVEVMELNELGDISTQGWTHLATNPSFKSNKAMDRGALLDFNSVLDTSRDVFVKVRFYKSIMP